MMEGVGNFLSRHRRKFIVTSCIVGGAVLGVNCARNYLIRYQERKMREMLDHQKRLQHFESTEATCNKVILSMGSEVSAIIIEMCRADELLERIRQNPANKKQLWDKVKIEVFTRLMSLIYACSLIVVALRIQLNLLGGYLYQDVTKHAHAPQIDDRTKQNYLLLSRQLIENGLPNLVAVVRNKCTEVLNEYSLLDSLKLSDMELIFSRLHKAMMADEGNDPCAHIAHYMMMPTTSPVDAREEQMIAETLDLMESDDAINICNSNISRGFGITLDAMAKYWSQYMNNADESDTNNYNFSDVGIPLAKIVPIINELTVDGINTHQSEQSLATSLLTYCLVMEKAKSLGANIYETFSTAPLYQDKKLAK